MARSARTIHVYENYTSALPVKTGCLFADYTRGGERCSFEFDGAWLHSPSLPEILDPDLRFCEGRQYPADKTIFGIFSDACPDRWGRKLLQRGEKITASREGRRPSNLTETDYLLGPCDDVRMGALRFFAKEEAAEKGSLLTEKNREPIPPFSSLNTLESAVQKYENDDDHIEESLLELLIRSGASLGGARPKATVQDKTGALWIAKFPSRNDGYPACAWEKTVHDLARLCGIRVPESKLEKSSGSGGIFLVKRFDRMGDRRIHYASAMTMLGRTDGASGQDGAGYPDLADFLSIYGAAPGEDLPELWRRIVFSMAVSNTDDHLRNHGFLLTPEGWRLSPAFDINPVPFGKALSLNINESDRDLSIRLAVESAGLYGLTQEEARTAASQILSTVRASWEKLAASYSLGRKAIADMRGAFRICYE